MNKCPHARIQFCPLYVESHHTRGFGCVDDAATPCRVERGKMSYAKAIAQLSGVDARLVATLAFNEDAHRRAAQRARNLRLNGVH